VPAALSVTGFDGIAEAERAGLTTVRQPVREKGRAAGRLLLDPHHARANPGRQRIITLETELRISTSSGPPRTAEQHWFGP
jgi:DNA-binding LacI/PurR family transcriptional regulator